MDNKKEVKNNVSDLIIMVALILMLVMAALPLFDINEEWMRWAYAAGAGVIFVMRLTQRYSGENLRIKRLYRLNIVAAMMFCASAALTFFSVGTGDWIALLMAGAVMQLYVSFMIDKEMMRDKQGPR